MKKKRKMDEFMEEERKNQESQQRLKDNIAKRKQDLDKKKRG